MAAPKLRFKEFDGDWSETSIGKLTKYFKGYAFKSESYKESGRRIIRVSDLGRDSIKYDNDAIFLDEVESSNYKDWMLKKDDIVITTVGSKPHLVDSAVGRPIYIRNNNEGLLNQNLLVLRPINQEVEPYFIFAQLLDNKYLTHIETIQRGNANQSNITVKDLQEFRVFSAQKIEQTKIASFLSAVDEKISHLTQKHKLLSQYKQGMMQKLFSQQIRFKADDGSEFGEWEDKILGDVIKFYNGKGHENNVDPNGDFVLINSKFVSSDTATFKKVDICNQKVFDDCLVMVMSDVPNGKALAKVLHITYGVKYALNQRIGMFVFNKKNHSKFFQYQLNRHKYYLAFDSGVGQTNLKKEEVLSCPILVPCIEEQTKIANFLSAIDQKIEVVAQQIEQAKQWKKGLLQQMFV